MNDECRIRLDSSFIAPTSSFLSLFLRPASFVMPSQYSREGVEQNVEIDGFAQDAEHMHAQGVVEQVRR